MIDLTPIANAVITLAALLITTFLIPWIKAKVNAEKLAEIQKWATIAVQAAEMIYSESGLGDKKKQYVKSYLQSKGYTLDIDTIDALIESAVMELKQKDPVHIIVPTKTEEGIDQGV